MNASLAPPPHADARPQSADAPVLLIENLSVFFRIGERSVPAVSDVSFDLRPGETLALVGESGSGKTVTSLSLVGLLPTQKTRIEGTRVEFTDRNGNPHNLSLMPLKKLNALRGNEIGIIFQEPTACLNPVHRIGDQIGESLRRHKGISGQRLREKVVALLEDVGIPEPERRAKQYPHELSGGMAQRATIAMAIACNPRLVIADEPTTALDVTTQGQILRLLKKLQQDNGMSMLFVTHNFGVVAEVAHRVAVMYAGFVVEQGPVEQLFRHPRHPYTRGLMSCLPQPGEALKLRRAGEPLPTIGGSVPGLTQRPAGCPFAPRCPMAIQACSERVPAPEETGGGHTTRCIRWREM